jgi:hypothetical protein
MDLKSSKNSNHKNNLDEFNCSTATIECINKKEKLNMCDYKFKFDESIKLLNNFKSANIANDNNEANVTTSSEKTNKYVKCNCVKCSITYHESYIKGVYDDHMIYCKKCKLKLANCKCCLRKLSTNCSNDPILQFEEKLLNIKNEMVIFNCVLTTF